MDAAGLARAAVLEPRLIREINQGRRNPRTEEPLLLAGKRFCHERVELTGLTLGLKAHFAPKIVRQCFALDVKAQDDLFTAWPDEIPVHTFQVNRTRNVALVEELPCQ